MIGKPYKKTFVKNPIPGTKFTIAISSAKGGVGKSTFATNLALALKNLGCKVGILDADIYGPSLPKLFSINQKPESDGSNLKPIVKYDIQCMSIGFLTDEQTPMIWRGPMVTSTIKTFAQKVSWNNLDFIIVDMPPGTGDTQLTFAQEIEMDGAIIVSTPQELALQDVKRGIKMFDKLGVKIIGLVDNMSFFKGEDGKKYPPVLIHRAILGSFERFLGILIENYSGKLPLWLAPKQLAILTVTDEAISFAEELKSIFIKSFLNK